jgi:hypothetical protein
MSNPMVELRHEKNAFGNLVVVVGTTPRETCKDCMHYDNKGRCSYYAVSHVIPTMTACRFFDNSDRG